MWRGHVIQKALVNCVCTVVCTMSDVIDMRVNLNFLVESDP